MYFNYQQLSHIPALLLSSQHQIQSSGPDHYHLLTGLDAFLFKHSGQRFSGQLFFPRAFTFCCLWKLLQSINLLNLFKFTSFKSLSLKWIHSTSFSLTFVWEFFSPLYLCVICPSWSFLCNGRKCFRVLKYFRQNSNNSDHCHFHKKNEHSTLTTHFSFGILIFMIIF